MSLHATISITDKSVSGITVTNSGSGYGGDGGNSRIWPTPLRCRYCGARVEEGAYCDCRSDQAFDLLRIQVNLVRSRFEALDRSGGTMAELVDRISEKLNSTTGASMALAEFIDTNETELAKLGEVPFRVRDLTPALTGKAYQRGYDQAVRQVALIAWERPEWAKERQRCEAKVARMAARR